MRNIVEDPTIYPFLGTTIWSSRLDNNDEQFHNDFLGAIIWSSYFRSWIIEATRDVFIEHMTLCLYDKHMLA